MCRFRICIHFFFKCLIFFPTLPLLPSLSSYSYLYIYLLGYLPPFCSKVFSIYCSPLWCVGLLLRARVTGPPSNA